MQESKKLAVFRGKFRPDLDLQNLCPPDFISSEVFTVFDLKQNTDLKYVVLISESLFATRCSAVSFLTRLRSLRELEPEIRSLPVVVLSPYQLDFLMRHDPGFMVFVSPRTRFLSPPHDPSRLAKAVEEASEEALDDFPKYLDVAGKLDSIRHRARHEIANFIGPEVLLSSAFSCGAIEAGNYERAQEQLFGKFTQSQLAQEYADLMDLLPLATPRSSLRPNVSSSQTLAELTNIDTRLLLIDDDHAAGWPEALSAVFGMETTIPSRNDFPVLSFRRGRLHLDCWVGHDPEELSKCLIGGPSREISRFDYDGIFLDMRLKREPKTVPHEELSGYELLRRIRQKDPSVHVVLFTASQNPFIIKESVEWGVCGYYIKEDVIPDPRDTNWLRLDDSMRGIREARWHREAFWILRDAENDSRKSSWFKEGDRKLRSLLISACEHLQALILTRREKYLSELLGLTVDRSVIETAFSVVEAAVRLQSGQAWKGLISEVIERHLSRESPAYAPAASLRTKRNSLVHHELGRGATREDIILAVTATCAVLNEASCPYHPSWLDAGLSLASWKTWTKSPTRMWIDLPSHLAASVSSRNESRGRLTSLVVKTKQTGEVLEVKDLSRVPSEERETITKGTLVEVRVTSVKTVRPEAILLRVLQARKDDAEETSARDNV